MDDFCRKMLEGLKHTADGLSAANEGIKRTADRLSAASEGIKQVADAVAAWQAHHKEDDPQGTATPHPSAPVKTDTEPIHPDTIHRLPAVVERTGLSQGTIYRMESRGMFPPRIQLGERAIGWREREIAAWITERQLAHEVPEKTPLVVPVVTHRRGRRRRAVATN